MSFWLFLNHWWNLPFLVMLGLCGAFLVLQAIGLLGAAADHDVHANAEVDLHPELHPDGEAAIAASASSAGAGMTAAWHEVLGFLGVGRVPFTVVWVTLFLFTGFSGLFTNRVLFVRASGDYRGWWFAPVLFGALAVGLVGVRLFSRLAARIVDIGGHGATSKHQLVGKMGVVASAVLDARFGEIRAHDDRGTELLLHGCLRAGEPVLARGAKVVLVSYDEERQLFWATPCPELEDGNGKGVTDVPRAV